MLTKSRPLVAEEEIFGIFDVMRIKHPHHEAAVAIFEKLRKRKKSYPNAQQTAGCLFAGSCSGKTTTVKWYIEKIIVPEWLASQPPHPEVKLDVLVGMQTIALHVELSGETTMSGLMSDFLEALGDPDAHSGTVKQRRFRVEKALAKRGYQIIFLDETQHIKTQTNAGPIGRQEDATSVQNTLKRWVKRWPIVFVGTQHAENVVFEHQVQTRTIPPINFGPLHFGREEDAQIVIEFCGRLALKIAQQDILKESPEILVDGDVPLCLNIASKGRLGLITIIVRMALEYAVGSGVRKLRREHLEKAVNNYSLRIGLCSYNPFTKGANLMPSIEEFANDNCIELI
ncbi:AAA domain-containing protein [Rhizobium sp. N113]|uniref:ATP-binding protein n=1 Tax=unclassified Rhizobium TaxID=2613769 RepID=UPI0007EB0226|nr:MULTISPECIES: ATP-binding protein [unclassified Rhizobium]ANL10331.1 AAA domain-containing protein [Rhizobium sp. N1341]ANL22382.1 AAA domain-containing protein [Rhizobium sp. N113]ANM41077.1 AAA domain-containing protein [Rhizobium sp. N741]